MEAPAHRTIFVAYPWNSVRPNRAEYKRALRGIERGFQVRFEFAEQSVTSGTILDKIRHLIGSTAFGIYDFTGWNPNVTLEYGMARGMDQKAFIIFNPEVTSAKEVPSDVRGWDRLQYTNLEDLVHEVEGVVINQLGLMSPADQFEEERQAVVQAVITKPGMLLSQVAEAVDKDRELVRVLLNRSIGEEGDLESTGGPRAVRFYPKQ